MIQSRFDSKHITAILRMAKHHLASHSELFAILFLWVRCNEHGFLFNSDACTFARLNFPDTTERRQEFVASVSSYVSTYRKNIEEAVMMLKSLHVEEKGSSDLLKISPSQHSGRKEAIIIIRRNSTDSRSHVVVQPFTRGSEGEPIWDRVEETSSIGTNTNNPGYESLLDCLFVREGSKATG